MGSYFGQSLRVSFFGESHGKALGCTLDGLPAGSIINIDELQEFLNRRRPGSSLCSPRQEPDKLEFISGCTIINTAEGRKAQTTGSPLTVLVHNQDAQSKDYAANASIMRPGHADLVAYQRFHGYQSIEGSGHFSGRISLTYCIAGGIAKQILNQEGISTHAHILRCAHIYDRKLDDLQLNHKQIKKLEAHFLPCIYKSSVRELERIVEEAKQTHNSYGAIVECVSYGFPAGIGSGHFAGIDSSIAQAIFGIPSVKSLEFGNGHKVAQLTGLENNDIPYYDDEGLIRFKTNNAGGILGGISTGAPIVILCGIKPTPSIAAAQESINITTGTKVELATKGRHDPCIAIRAVPVVEAMVSLALLDSLLSHIEAKPGAGNLHIQVASSNEQTGSLKDEQEARIDTTPSNKMLAQKEASPVPRKKRSKQPLSKGRLQIPVRHPFERNTKLVEEDGLDFALQGFSALKDKKLSSSFVKLASFKGMALTIRPTGFKQELLDAHNFPLCNVTLPEGNYGLLGKNLEYSYSPEVYKALAGLDYTLFELEEHRIKDFIQKGDWQGLSITTPYKTTVLPWMDDITNEAKRIGSINVCKRDSDGRIIGHNTDYFGFRESFRQMMLKAEGINKNRKRYMPKQLRALVLGTGGAAQSVQLVLQDEGILVNCISPHSKPGLSDINQFLDAHIIINASPVGTFPNTRMTPLDGYTSLKYFKHLRAVIDLTYNPLCTRLMNKARKLHIPAFSGMDMLVYQAFAALEFFSGQTLERNHADDLCAYMNELHKFSRWFDPCSTEPKNTEARLCKPDETFFEIEDKSHSQLRRDALL